MPAKRHQTTTPGPACHDDSGGDGLPSACIPAAGFQASAIVDTIQRDQLPAEDLRQRLAFPSSERVGRCGCTPPRGTTTPAPGACPRNLPMAHWWEINRLGRAFFGAAWHGQAS